MSPMALEKVIELLRAFAGFNMSPEFNAGIYIARGI